MYISIYILNTHGQKDHKAALRIHKAQLSSALGQQPGLIPAWSPGCVGLLSHILLKLIEKGTSTIQGCN